MYTIGIDVGGTNLKAGLVDAQYRIAAVEKMPLRWESPEKFAADLAALSNGLIAQKGIAREEVAAIGVGLPGQVDPTGTVVVRTVNIPIRNLPLADLIRRQWEVPIFLGNDADCAALGEFYHFEDRSIKNLILVTLGTGIGTGVILNGKIHRGVNGCAGEGGHMVIVSDGVLCTCGRRGCWERYSSASGLIRMTKEEMERCSDSAMWTEAAMDMERVDGRTAFEAAKKGDAAAKRVVDQYIRYLADGVTNLINLLQPEVICIGGGLSNEDDAYLLHPLQKRVEELRYDKDAPSHTQIVKAKLGNDAGIIGAALLGRS